MQPNNFEYHRPDHRPDIENQLNLDNANHPDNIAYDDNAEQLKKYEEYQRRTDMVMLLSLGNVALSSTDNRRTRAINKVYKHGSNLCTQVATASTKASILVHNALAQMKGNTMEEMCDLPTQNLTNENQQDQAHKKGIRNNACKKWTSQLIPNGSKLCCI